MERDREMERERDRERNRKGKGKESERIKVRATIFLNRPGQNEKNPRTSEEAVYSSM
jgi:hypothetical protein